MKIKAPLLVAYRQPFERGNTAALVLDCSSFSDEDLDRAIRLWKGQISKSPDAWKDGFKLAKFRETFRSLLERYGTEVLTIVQS